MTEERTRKRAWGRTKNRGKGPPGMEQMDCQVEPSEQPVKRIKLSEDTSSLQSTSKIDLQHPELMSDATLVSVLNNVKVPIPVYEDGTPSRERLLYLFKKHVTPQPQRTSGRFWRKRWSSAHQNKGHTAHATESMETDSNDWSSDLRLGNSSDIASSHRKRDLEDSDPPTVSKRPALQIPYTSLSKITVSDSSPVAATPEVKGHPSPTKVKGQSRLLKLKRPLTSSVNNTPVPQPVSGSQNSASKLTTQTHTVRPVNKITWP